MQTFFFEISLSTVQKQTTVSFASDNEGLPITDVRRVRRRDCGFGP